ncbi:MAG: hypothetical protein OSA51_00140 [Octadecabacter sp.]|nr:hypothetical protein [Octadecabacter sp.]
MMRRVCSVLILMQLVACAQAQPIPLQRAVFRDLSAQIASQTNVTADRLAGNWVVRQRFANQPGPVGGVTFSTLPNDALQMAQTHQTCDLNVCVIVHTQVLLKPMGLGRWMPLNSPMTFPSQQIWVMWMDFESRTAAIGSPSGQFGWIMDKNPTGGDDRIIAARDIMDWFGYDVANLQE